VIFAIEFVFLAMQYCTYSKNIFAVKKEKPRRKDIPARLSRTPAYKAS